MKTPDISPVFDRLRQIYLERRSAYGDSYFTFGEMMNVLFPEGINLKGRDHFMIFGLLVHVLTKMARFTCKMPDEAHSDSLQDMAVYALLIDGVANMPLEATERNLNNFEYYEQFLPAVSRISSGWVEVKIKNEGLSNV